MDLALHRHSPPAEPGKFSSAVLTVLVHGLLAAVLFFGVQWQRRPPESISVELVRPAPEPAAPRRAEPPPPPAPQPRVADPKVETPPPPKPDIALKEPKPAPKPKVEPKPEPKPEKPEPKVEPKPAPEPPKTQPEDRLQQLMEREAAAARQQALLKNETERVAQAANAAAHADVRDAWKEAIRNKVRGNMAQVPPSIRGKPSAEFQIELMSDGSIIGTPRLRRSSGNKTLDDIIERAILASNPLPLPSKREAFERIVILSFYPLGEP